MNYTKGEWKRHNTPNGEHIWGGDEHIADFDGENANANAKLCAAAPDMYQALNAIIARRTECHQAEAAHTPHEIELACNAIAKAEGK